MTLVARPDTVLVASAGGAATSGGAGGLAGAGVCAEATPEASANARAEKMRMPYFTCANAAFPEAHAHGFSNLTRTQRLQRTQREGNRSSSVSSVYLGVLCARVSASSFCFNASSFWPA